MAALKNLSGVEVGDYLLELAVQDERLRQKQGRNKAYESMRKDQKDRQSLSDLSHS